MSYRIIKVHTGYVAQEKKRTWYGLNHWVTYISVSGMKDKAWVHSTYEYALKSIIFKLREEIIINRR